MARIDARNSPDSHIEAISNPAAAADWSKTIPTNEQWLIQQYHAKLITDATSANRNYMTVITDGSNIVLELPVNFTHIASVTRAYNFSPAVASSLGNDTAQSRINAPWTPLLLEGGDVISSSIANKQAGDQLSEINLLVKRWRGG